MKKKQLLFLAALAIPCVAMASAFTPGKGVLVDDGACGLVKNANSDDAILTGTTVFIDGKPFAVKQAGQYKWRSADGRVMAQYAKATHTLTGSLNGVAIKPTKAVERCPDESGD